MAKGRALNETDFKLFHLCVSGGMQKKDVMQECNISNSSYDRLITLYNMAKNGCTSEQLYKEAEHYYVSALYNDWLIKKFNIQSADPKVPASSGTSVAQNIEQLADRLSNIESEIVKLEALIERQLTCVNTALTDIVAYYTEPYQKGDK